MKMLKIIGIIVVLVLLNLVCVFAGSVVVKNGQLNVTNTFYTGTNLIYADQSGGKVGIGTLNPGAKLDVNGILNATEYSGAMNFTYLQNYPNACSEGQYVSAVGDTLTCGTPTSGGTTDSHFHAAENITAGTFGSGNFAFSNNLSVDTNVLYVDSSENKVGIGIATPQYMLDVNGNASVKGIFDINATGFAEEAPVMRMYKFDGSLSTILTSSGYFTGPGVSSPSGTFSTELFVGSNEDVALGSSGLETKQKIATPKLTALNDTGLRIEDDGNNLGIFIKDGGQVGIGTNNPSSRLSVNGAISSTGSLDFNMTGLGELVNVLKIYNNEGEQLNILDASGSLNASTVRTSSYVLAGDGVLTNFIVPVTGSNLGISIKNDSSAYGIFVDNNGRVAIGKDSASSMLDINGLVNATEYSGAMNWTNLQTYPSACSEGEYVSAVGDVLTCGTPAGGATNSHLHAAENITSGTFGSGNFAFQNNVSVDTNVFFVDSVNNKVGIGTATPQQPLHVFGTTPLRLERTGENSIDFVFSGGAVGGDAIDLVLQPGSSETTGYQFKTYSGGLVTAMSINGTGNVGIGTTTPMSRLAVSNGGNEGIEISPSGGATGGYIQSYNRGTSAYAGLDFYGSVFTFNGASVGIGTGSPGTDLEINSTTPDLTLRWATGDNYLKIGGSDATGAYINNPDNTNLSLIINGQYGVFMNSAAFVGIGTTSPDQKLTLPYNSKIGWEYSSGDSGVYHAIGYPYTGGGPMVFDVSYTGTATSPIYAFNGSDGTKLTILQGGNVGIGNTTPSEKLEVVGTIKTDAGGGSGGTIHHNFATSTGVLRAGLGLIDATDNGGRLAIWTYNATGSYIGTGMTMNLSTNDVYFGSKLGLGILPAVALDVDPNSNTEGLRIRGTDGANEMADMYVGSGGTFVIDNTKGSDDYAYIDLRSEDADYGIIIRESDGTGTDTFGNIFVADASDDYMTFTVNSGTSDDALVVTASDRVGVGTATPLSLLSVEDATSTTILRIANNNGSAGSTSEIRFGCADSTGAGAVGNTCARITAGKEQEWTSGDAGDFDGYLAINTALNDAYTEKVRVTSTGDVGINTKSPGHISYGGTTGYKILGVESTTANRGAVLELTAGTMIDGTGNPAGYVALLQNDSGTYREMANIRAWEESGGNDKATLSFGTLASGTNATNDRMVIDSNGDVGIGDSSPAQKLVVSGAAVVTSGVYGAETGAADTTIWAVSGEYPTWGMAYDEGSPDTIQFKSAGSVNSAIALDSGNSYFNALGGNVGIGATEPVTKFDVYNNSDDTGIISTVRGGSLWVVKDGSLANADRTGRIYLGKRNAAQSTYIEWSATGDNQGRFQIMGGNTYFDSSYNVGIGATAPTQKLDVAGNVNLTGSANQTIYFAGGGYIYDNGTAMVIGHN